MKAASLKEIKLELGALHPQQLLELFLRLAKYKKENKELLTYLLFEKIDENQYVCNVKLLADEMFEGVNKSSSY